MVAQTHMVKIDHSPEGKPSKLGRSNCWLSASAVLFRHWKLVLRNSVGYQALTRRRAIPSGEHVLKTESFSLKEGIIHDVQMEVQRKGTTTRRRRPS